jgi:hypothetical protein
MFIEDKCNWGQQSCRRDCAQAIFFIVVAEIAAPVQTTTHRKGQPTLQTAYNSFTINVAIDYVYMILELLLYYHSACVRARVRESGAQTTCTISDRSAFITREIVTQIQKIVLLPGIEQSTKK